MQSKSGSKTTCKSVSQLCANLSRLTWWLTFCETKKTFLDAQYISATVCGSSHFYWRYLISQKVCNQMPNNNKTCLQQVTLAEVSTALYRDSSKTWIDIIVSAFRTFCGNTKLRRNFISASVLPYPISFYWMTRATSLFSANASLSHIEKLISAENFLSHIFQHSTPISIQTVYFLYPRVSLKQGFFPNPEKPLHCIRPDYYYVCE